MASGRRWSDGLARALTAAAVLLAATGCASRRDDGATTSDENDGGGGPAPTPTENEPRDGGRDARSDVDAPAMGCSGSSELPIVGDWLAADGSEHWLRTTPRATTYTRIPGGPPTNDAPPTLRRVIVVCGDQRSFLAADAAGAVTRVDWSTDAGGLLLCIAARGVADVDAALAAPPSDRASKSAGCHGGPWISLSAIADGGA